MLKMRKNKKQRKMLWVGVTLMEKILKILGFIVVLVIVGIWLKFTVQAIAETWYETQIKVYKSKGLINNCEE
jgi:hypothetical protein